MRYRSLKDISSLHVQEEKKEPEEKKSDSEEQQDLFAKAMQGVTPLENKGRQVPAQKDKPARPVYPMQENTLEKIVKGSVEFEIEYTDEYMQAHVLGMDPRYFRKLKQGRYSVEKHIDLHGLNSEQALLALHDFIRDAYLQDKRCLLVITGRGKNSPEGQSVLKGEIQNWLTRDPFRRVILAFCTALPRDGGAGALYVLLRKAKKTRGKIVWDRLPPDLP